LICGVDTLDLQDHENPTAAEHTKHPEQDGLAPNLASQVHHVIQERRDEEESLADAWNVAGSLAEEPGGMDEAQANGDPSHATNGTHAEGGENGEGGAESEAEGEDDMMDRISSSPSIEDGGCLLRSLPSLSTTCTLHAEWRWPARTSSLSPTPASTPSSGIFNSSAASSVESSPFLRTPQHLPQYRPWAEGEASPLSKAMD